MQINFAPDLLGNQLVRIFRDSKRPCYCQIATIDTNTLPSVRTVHVRWIEAFQSTGFSTHTHSKKWQQLKKNPYLAGCLLAEDVGLQIRWQAAAHLVEEETCRKTLWQVTRSDVRRGYWQEWSNEGSSIEALCPGFGVVVFEPIVWDILEINEQDYAKEKRTLYRYDKGEWSHQRISNLTTLPL